MTVSDQDIAMFRAGKRKGADKALGISLMSAVVAVLVTAFVPEDFRVLVALAIVISAIAFYTLTLPR